MAEQEENANSDAVVTMVDVLKEQEDFEENANAVLGASDDKNCTYQKGYVKRQALYACLTCCSDSKTDVTKRAGLCLACSLTCHENHELVELYTKRNFRCDCGGPKFNSHPCQFAPLRRELNNDNKYNQNFSGVYCICHRPYPDPEATTEEEMIQCIICEDWLHTRHLEANVPANDQYSEMICKQCMDNHCFLDDYIEYSVNLSTELSDNNNQDVHNSSVLNTDQINDSNISNINVSISENENTELGTKELMQEQTNVTQILQNVIEEEGMKAKCKMPEINKSELDDTSSEQLTKTLNTIETEGNEVKSDKSNISGDEKKLVDNSNEKGVPDNDINDNPDYVNSNIDVDSQIKDLKDVNQKGDNISINNFGDTNLNDGIVSERKNEDLKEPNKMENTISNIESDDANPNSENDIQIEEFREANNVDDIIPDKTEEMNEKQEINVESVLQLKEFIDSNTVGIIPTVNDEIVSLKTLQNITSDLENSTPSETVYETNNSPMSAQKEENYVLNENKQEKSSEVKTDKKYDDISTSEEKVNIDTTEHLKSDEKDSFENDKTDKTISVIDDEKKDAEKISTSDKTQNEESETLLHPDDNEEIKKELNKALITCNKVQNIDFSEPVSIKPKHSNDTEEDNNDNSMKTEKVVIKLDCNNTDIVEKCTSEFTDASNRINLEVSDQEMSNIDKLDPASEDINKCDSNDENLVTPIEKNEQDDMDIDKKEERSPVQAQDQCLSDVNEISPKTIEDNVVKVEFNKITNENIEINNIPKTQESMELATSNEINPNKVVNMSDNDEENLVKDNKMENQMKDMVTESADMQECKIRNENITQDPEQKESCTTTTVDNNDIEMKDVVSETSDVRISSEITNSDERINEDTSKVKNYIKSGSDKCNNDISKIEKLVESDISNEVDDNTSNIKQTISEDVDMANIESNANPIRSNNENESQLDNSEKHVESEIIKDALGVPHTCDNQSIKRKQDSEHFIEGKKIKIEGDENVTDTIETIQCFRPYKSKNGHKGATFWPCNWRKKLCSCYNCVAMYKNNDVQFLMDVEDTVSAYEDLGKSSNANSQYAKGLEALSSLDRIQQINAITEYNKMKEKLLDFLKSFKDKREVVKEEDIKEFFAGMKPRREPDGVYFCR